ncbi:molecular chaperone of HSP90 family [Halobacteroides halobius DSM 5150]|uniref:Chaperone protein HtpG n=1 Tax=Halobacteroides halobius (strain ATCC 35273 / DSM 5150 / MD-1) TaxID=748449 RepID=L0K8L8_HALHC|nr:molecular chaperone HtpG [Halobacteroides halobius]AGB41632.1 molecular chaperone of HSP90 family [Halobacteroides halobius DSM 5150]
MTAKEVEKKEFQTETQKVLDLMINSIYTNQEIFLRELIANASDAIDKVKFQSLTDVDLLEGDSDFEIWLDIDEENNVFTIKDNGIGMTYDEVIESIGTIAQSGSQKFLHQLQQKQAQEDDALDLIGQFGVGFYSAFMVADKVTLSTKAPREDTAIKWESTGDGTYTIEEVAKDKRGTTIKLHLRDEFVGDEAEIDLTKRQTIEQLVKKHSNYVEYPIKMKFYEDDEDGNVTEEIKTLNSMKPLWVKNKGDIKEEEYNEFYQEAFNDWTEPLEVIHNKVEGLVKYAALLFIPQQAPSNIFSEDFDQGLRLYSKNNFVMDNCSKLLPDYLRFVRGLVDSPDFNLNLSRQVLQDDKQLKVISKTLEKRVLKRLKKILTNDRDKYRKFWSEFGQLIKSGANMTFGQKQDKLVELMIFPSSDCDSEMTTLNEYVNRMKEDQDVIYYVTGEDKMAVENMPQMELLQEKGLEVLYFFDEIDEFVINNLREYDDIEFKSVLRGDLDLDDAEDDVAADQDEVEELLTAIEDNLEGKVSDVRLSRRLKSSAVCLVSGDAGLSMSMEKVLEKMNQNMGQAQRILEINPNHELFNKLEQIYNTEGNSEQLAQYSELLYSLASLMEGFTPDDPVALSDQITELMVKAN